MSLTKKLGVVGLAAVTAGAAYIGYKQAEETLAERAFYENYSKNNAPVRQLKTGSDAPEINQQSFNGKGHVNLADLNDKVVLLDFWATWCGPCKAVTPEIEKIYSECKDKGLEVISIATMEKSEDDLRAYLQKHNFAYPVVFDKNEQLKQAYAVQGIPRFVLIKNGKIEAISEGLGRSTDDLLARIRAQLAR